MRAPARRYHRAAERGHTGSAYRLALILAKGNEPLFKANLKGAMYWLLVSVRIRAVLRRASALELMCARGHTQGSARNFFTEQRELADSAPSSEEGKLATARVAQLYLDGIGVVMDWKLAEEWFMRTVRAPGAASLFRR
jgi:TPR repeat protein